jgi:hypothetical protein
MNQRFTKKRGLRKPFSFAIIVFFLGLFGVNAWASEDSIVLDRVAVTVGSFFGKTDSDLRLDVGAGDFGTEISFENDLGLNSDNSIFRIGAEFRPWKRHQFGVSYYKLSRSASTTLNREIEFEGVIFPINITVNAFLDTKLLSGTYTFWVSVRDRTAFGLSAGLTGFTVETGIGSTNPTLEAQASTDLPVPMFGAEFRGAILDPLRFTGKFQILPEVTINDYSGRVYDYSVELEYRFIKNVGVAVAYSGFNVDLKVEKRVFFGDIHYDIQGVQVFGRVAF